MDGGTVFTRENNVIVVHDGRRGPRGYPGADSTVPGPPGAGIVVHGPWQDGTSYGPRDAVSWRSTLLAGANSLYVQRSSFPQTPSTTPPHLDPSRWNEIGAKDWGNAFGGIWEVQQLNHGFSHVGEPVGFSATAGRYVLAQARHADDLAIAVVREVVSEHRAILQSTGEVPNVDPRVIHPDGSSWIPGRVYYVTAARGRVSATPPTDASIYANPILMAAAQNGAGGVNAVALPWTPVSGRQRDYVPVGLTKFYFTIADATTEISGADDAGRELAYAVGDTTDVFVDGSNLFRDDYTAEDGLSITFAQQLAPGSRVEVWTPDRPLDLLIRSTMLKVDNIEELFDGLTTVFDLTYGGQPVTFQNSTAAIVTLDATPQEPLIDYEIVSSAGDPDHAAIQFFNAPVPGTRFWATALTPAGQQNLPPGGATDAVLTKLSSADGDVGWTTVIHGGAF